ncbi:MAG: acyltransferase [Eubacteriales bacterium]|nr:acyltransferase [Eubacteriales bacterium]
MRLRTIKKVVYIGIINHVLSGTFAFSLKRRMLNAVGYEIGKGTKVVGPIYCTAKLKAGENVWIGRALTVEGNGSVEIGDNCDLAPAVTFLTGGHRIGTHGRRAGQGESYSIYVGKGTWIGARSTICGNVKIGDGCITAAGTCVVKDVEDDCLVGGVPAGVIRKLTDESEKNS